MKEPTEDVNVGDLGESLFNDLCTKSGLQVNTSHKDGTGWDFYVESRALLPMNPTPANQLHEGAIQCKVQVKSSYKTNDRELIKLSNLHRMCTDPLPYFVMLAEFDKRTTDVVKTYLVHIDQNYIFNVLKRIRELDINHPDRELHKRKMSVTADDSMEFEPTGKGALMNVLKSHIGVSQSLYTQKKHEHLQNVGYEKGQGVVYFDLTSTDGMPSIIDVAIGKANSTPAQNFRVYKQRFGIADNEPSYVNAIGELGISIEPVEALVAFKLSTLAPEYSFPVKIYNPRSLNEGVEESQRKIRIEGNWFDIVFNPDVSGECQMEINFNNELELTELNSAIDLLDAVSASNKEILICIRKHEKTAEIMTLTARKSKAPPHEVREAVKNAFAIANRFKQQPEGAVRLDDLVHYQKELSQFDNLLERDKFLSRSDMKPNCAHVKNDNDYAVIHATGTAIGPSIYVVLLVAKGPAKLQANGEYLIWDKSTELGRKLILKRGDSFDWAGLHDEMKQEGLAYEATHNVFINENNIPKEVLAKTVNTSVP